MVESVANFPLTSFKVDVKEDQRWGIYVHVPFCALRCGYCDFNTYVINPPTAAVAIESWKSAVLREITISAAMLATAPAVKTIFFGGGTPSYVGAEVLIAIYEHICVTFGCSADCEITVECNPESVTQQFFVDLFSAGFTRISLGMQSYNRRVLEILDRQHDPDNALKAVEQAYSAGFEHISVDLIYGTPQERTSEWINTITAVMATPVDHISAYGLTVEKGTALSRKVRAGIIQSPDDDTMADHYGIIDDILSDYGFSWYEISNWAKRGGQCQHNLGYWHSKPWWGYGPGAHSYLGNIRWWNHKLPRKYSSLLAEGQLPIDGYETLSDVDTTIEHIMLSLRLREGLNTSTLNNKQHAVLQDYAYRGYVIFNDQRAILTRTGRLIANSIITDIINEL